MAASRRESKKPTGGRTHSRSNEIVSILLLALGLLLLLCLFSYNPNDPSWNADSSFPRQNLIGYAGAVVADIFLQSFGLIAYVIPLLVGLIAWQCFRSVSLRVPLTSALAFILFVVTLAGLLALTDYKFLDASVKLGGMTGDFVAWLFVFWLSKIGTAILLSALAIAAFIYITNFSLTVVFADLRHYLENIVGWLRREKAADSAAVAKCDKGTPVEDLSAAENKHAKKLRDEAKNGDTGKKVGIAGIFQRLSQPPPTAEEKAQKPAAVEEIKEEKKN